ncbi:MAG: LpqN/LpqT family lipoprotein [Mycobacterium sp.]|nr:LpqN/LpqT family lipoprotein [Mycobacterium sp.]
MIDRAVRGLGIAATVIAVAVGAVGCGARTADYSSLVTTSAKTTESTSTTPTPIAQYLASAGVTGQQVALDKLTDLTVTLPRPPGWTTYANPNFSPGTEAIAKNNNYPTALVMVFKLDGDFDVALALKHADADAELSKKFTKLNSSADDFKGFPSSMIEGSYDLNGTRVHTYNRVVIPVTPAPRFQRYLVQLTVTTLADQAAAQAPDVGQIINGFTVTVK